MLANVGIRFVFGTAPSHVSIPPKSIDSPRAKSDRLHAFRRKWQLQKLALFLELKFICAKCKRDFTDRPALEEHVKVTHESIQSGKVKHFFIEFSMATFIKVNMGYLIGNIYGYIVRPKTCGSTNTLILIRFVDPNARCWAINECYLKRTSKLYVRK